MHKHEAAPVVNRRNKNEINNENVDGLVKNIQK